MSQTVTNDEQCVICGKQVLLMCYKNTGVCSERCMDVVRLEGFEDPHDYEAYIEHLIERDGNAP